MLLDGVVTTVSVDLNVLDLPITWRHIPHLLLLRVPIARFSSDKFVAKFSARAFVVGAIQHSESIELAGYICHNSVAEAIFEELGDDVELFKTEFDEGGFYRSFLLPLDFRKVFVSMLTQVELARPSTAINRSVLAIHRLNLNAKSKIEEFLSSRDVGMFTPSISGQKVSLARRTSLDVSSEHHDLVKIYKAASDANIEYMGVDYDLR